MWLCSVMRAVQCRESYVPGLKPCGCALQFPCKMCALPHHGLTKLYHQGYFDEEPKVPNPSPEVEGDAIIPLGIGSDRIGIRVRFLLCSSLKCVFSIVGLSVVYHTAGGDLCFAPVACNS